MIQNIKTNANNVFSLFPKYSLEQADVVSKDSNIKEQTLEKDTVELNSETKNSNSKKKILFGSTIASIILTAGVFGLVLVKGVHGGAFKEKISSLNSKLTQDIHDIGQSKDIQNIPTKIVYHTKKTIKKLLDILQASSNFTTFKDYGSTAAFQKTKPTKAFSDKSTSMFKKVVDKTLGKKYTKVETNLRDFSSILREYNIKNLESLDPAQLAQEVTIKGETKTLKEWVGFLAEQSQNLVNAYDSNFSAGARKLRDKSRTEMISDLPQKIHQRFFKDKKSLFNLENYKTYATEDIAKPAQEELRRTIVNGRKEVTNNISLITSHIKTSVNTFFDTVKPTDTATRTHVQKLRKQLETFKACSGSTEADQRLKISKEILYTLDNIQKSFSSGSAYSENEQKMMAQLIDDIKNSVKDSCSADSKGNLQKIMTVLKGLNKEGIISDVDLNFLKELSGKITKGLNKATELEAGEYFLKQAELKVGSAPTDVLSVLLPVGAGAYSIAKCDDKDEKISATLTTCIPLVGTFATFVYGTVKMFSGAKNLIFSGISGLLLSELGNYADKLYKKYKQSGSVTNVVKEEATNFWTGLEPQIKQFEETKDTQK